MTDAVFLTNFTLLHFKPMGRGEGMVQDKLTEVMMINQPKGEGGMPMHHDAIKLFIKMIMSQTIGRN